MHYVFSLCNKKIPLLIVIVFNISINYMYDFSLLKYFVFSIAIHIFNILQ